MTITEFECPKCHEEFQYTPSGKTQKIHDDSELKLARSYERIVNCPHCDAVMLVHLDTGRTEVLDVESRRKKEYAGVTVDLQLREQTWEKAGKLIEQGHACMDTDVTRAESFFRQALSISKHNPVAWYDIGVCRFQAGDHEQAIRCLKHALQFDPKLIQAWNNLGAVYAIKAMYDEAIRCYDQGIALDPNHAKCYMGKAKIAMLRNDKAEFGRLVQIVLEKDPKYAMAQLQAMAAGIR